MPSALLPRRRGWHCVIKPRRATTGRFSQPMEVLQEIRQCCGPDAVIALIDSGFRRGTDVVKALALGANGVLIGQEPVLYGVAAFGEAGAKQALNIILQRWIARWRNWDALRLPS